jgi:hypothetical protein
VERALFFVRHSRKAAPECSQRHKTWKETQKIDKPRKGRKTVATINLGRKRLSLMADTFYRLPTLAG